MNFDAIDVELVASLLLLLLIGMGPKIAMVPFLEKTKTLEAAQQRAVGGRMVKIAVLTALGLFATGAVLMRMLHISEGAVSVAGGVVLLLMAVKMAAGPDTAPTKPSEDVTDLDKLAVYPLAVPYLLNPVGIVVLIIASGKVATLSSGALVVGLVLAVGAFDFLIFRNIDKLSKRMSPSMLVISEVVFGILLTAVSVELLVRGLSSLGVVNMTGAH
jgi:multiple antibiotic resistance protein